MKPAADLWPRLVVFAIPLRDPLPMPDRSTFTKFLDERAEVLDDVGLRITDERGSFEPAVKGQRLASLRIWQLPLDPSPVEQDLFHGAMEVLNHVSGADTPSKPDGLEDAASYRTVVEGVVLLRTPDDMVAGPDHDDPLTICLNTLFDLVRAYRLLPDVRISELTYERIMPLIPYTFRRLEPPEYFGGTAVMMLDHANVSVPNPDILDERRLQEQTQLLNRLTKQDPFLLYAERRLEARIAISRDGQYADGAVQSAIAAEVLLSGLLGMVMWEESLPKPPVETASEVFATDVAKRVRTHYHPRLGGQWSLRGDGPVSRWYGVTAGLRNRVVHRGYRPSRTEVEDSLQTLYALEKFIADRLAARSERFPRTALAMLGADGLARRGKWSDERFSDDAIGTIPDYLGEYSTWRASVDEATHRRRTR